MASATSEPPSVKNDSLTLKEQNGDAGSIDNLKRRSTFSEQQIESKQADPLSEKALEEASPAYDESKILSGRKLFFAFVAMLLSVLLIALGVSFVGRIRAGLGLILFVHADQTISAPAL